MSLKSDHSAQPSTSKIQRWSPELYDTKAKFVGDLASAAVDLLNIVPGERILDLGCGDGYLSQKLVNKGAVLVGADFSPELVTTARGRGIDARHYNGEELDFSNEFDGAFSNAAMHWMKRADLVADGIFRALKPGGRFVGEFAGKRNAQIIRTAVHGSLDAMGFESARIDPWYLPDAEEYNAVLVAAGFSVEQISHFDRPVVIDYHVSDWIRTFGSPYLSLLSEDQKTRLLDEVTETIRPSLYGADGKWTVDYTRVRFLAVKPLGV
jgi:trans-aconitate methyltransferase